MLEQVFGALEAFRQLLAHRLLDDARAGEADQRAGLGDLDVAQHGEARGDAAGGRIGQHDDVGQARFLHQLDRDGAARHLHQADHAFLHARAARGGVDDQRRFLQHREPRGGDQAFADGRAHRAAHELEGHRRDHGLVPADRAVRDDDRVLEMRLVARLPQPVGVALAVAEAQRVGRRARQLDAVPAALVEGPGQALGRGRAHVVAAMRADLEVLLEVAVEDHLLAGGALRPEIVRHLALAEQGADLRPDIFGEPAHAGISCAARALRTPSASARTPSSTRSRARIRRVSVRRPAWSRDRRSARRRPRRRRRCAPLPPPAPACARRSRWRSADR